MSAPAADTTKPTPRAAYDSTDVEASRAAHDANTAAGHIEKHGGTGSDFIKSIVFGGLDGIITTFSTIASVAGGSLPIEVVITLGFANLIADGISMGLGDGLSSKAEYDFIMSERKREVWEFENYPKGEIDEMVNILQEKGFDNSDAREIIETIATKEHQDFFIDFMMNEELGEDVPDDPWGPAKEGAATFISFLIFGSVPMWIYVFTYAGKYTDAAGVFGIAAAATAVTLFMLGALQGKITRQSILRSGTSMMINGSLAAASAYLVSWGILQSIGNGTTCM